MQSLFDACASKMTHREYDEIRVLPTPTTVINFLFGAKQTRHHFKKVYEEQLGEVADNCFVFSRRGYVHIADTLANIEKCDLKQGFRYNCAFGNKEQLAAIWKKLTDEYKAALNGNNRATVQYYSTLMTEKEASTSLRSAAFMETLVSNWITPMLDVYRSCRVDDKKQCLFLTWLAALMVTGDTFRMNLCNAALAMQKERDFDFDDADRTIYKAAIRGQSLSRKIGAVKKVSKICGLQEFEVWVLEVAAEV